MKRLFFLFPFLLLLSCSGIAGKTVTTVPTIFPLSTIQEQDTYAEKRQKMLRDIKAMGVQDGTVLQAIEAVPRHKFVPSDYLDQAYANHPLPIGYGQTISQPFMVAWMTEQLELQPGDKVLEIGTGSGYQAAILAELGDVDVYSIEIVTELAAAAEKRLQELGYTDIHTKQGDGYYGWAEYAPFDAIIVTAAPDHLPAPLVEQLSGDGRIIIPLGPPGLIQTLWKFAYENGELKAYNLGGVAFVPLTGPGVEQHAREATPTP